MVPHAGADTRVFREVSELGAELSELRSLMGSPTQAHAVLLFDWDSWWAIEQRGQATTSSYLALVSRWHAALTEAGLTVDLARGDGDLTGYPIVVVPSLYVLTDAQAAAIDAAARSGSSVLVTDQTGIVDENLRVHLGGYLGGLRSTLGVWIEEFSPLTGAWAKPGGIPVTAEATVAPTVRVCGDVFADGSATAGEWAEAVRIRDAETRAVFHDGPLAGWPALTRNRSGRGAAWYLATRVDRAGRAAVVRALIAESAVEVPHLFESTADSGFVESVRRGDAHILINHGTTEVRVSTTGTDLLTGEDAEGMTLPPHGVAIVVPVPVPVDSGSGTVLVSNRA
jgi:beta-galactosidase